jgi:hypothetical protein
MKRKQEPSADIFYALHDAGVSSETALRRAGYKVKNARAVISMKHKLLRRRESTTTTGYSSDHPAVIALTPALRARWDSLAPSIRAWYLGTTTLNPLIDTDDKTDDLSLCDIPGDMEMLLSTRCTGDLARGGRWDKIAKGVPNAGDCPKNP